MTIIAQIRPETHYAWRGPSVLVVDNQGRAGEEQTLSGYYFRETRYVRTLRLEIDGDTPFAASVAEVAPNRLEFSQIYPPVQARGGGGTGSGGTGRTHDLLYRTLDLRLVFQVHPASLEVVLQVGNRWNERAEFDLAWALSADYAGLSEAQSGKREQETPVEATPEPSGVRYRYTHEALPFETHVSVDGPGEWRYADGRLSARVRLERQQMAEVRLTVRAVDSTDALDQGTERRREESERAWQEQVMRLFAPAETPLAELANRAFHDVGSLALLDGPEEEWLTPAAGMPMYPATFGRDALTTGWQAALIDRGDQVRSTLAKVRRLQGTAVDAWRDEQPGRIIQQARSGPLARLSQTPFARYYGDYASPFMFILALGQLYAWSGEKRDVEGGFVVLGLDAEKRPIRSLTSNAAQCLTTGIVRDEHLPRLVRRTFQPDLYSGWGLRTLSTENPAYDPLAYHLGSVWAVENGTILFGLRRFGFDDRVEELARSLYDLARVWPGGRIPEAVGGYSHGELVHPGAYPRANAPQAWNQSMYAILIQTLLGLRPVAALELLALDPKLPPWLPEITLKRLRVGGATVTLRFRRDDDGGTSYDVLEQAGTLRIVNQPPLDALNVGIWNRLGALAEGVLPFR